jgi:hypothetical protein
MYIFLERFIPERMQNVLQAFLKEIAYMASCYSSWRNSRQFVAENLDCAFRGLPISCLQHTLTNIRLAYQQLYNGFLT